MPRSPSSLMRLLVLLAALALPLAACSDDDGGDPPATEDGGPGDEAATDVPDPCSLVSAADLEAFFGSPFEEGEATDNLDEAGILQCAWSTADASPTKVVSVAVATNASQQAAFGIGADEVFEQTRTQAQEGGTLVEADLGLGDASFRTGFGVYVLDGDVSYSIAITGTSDDTAAGLDQLAAKVVEG